MANLVAPVPCLMNEGERSVICLDPHGNGHQGKKALK